MDALREAALKRTADKVSGLGERPDSVQDISEGHASPFGYIRPALFAGQMCDLAAPRKALEFINRESGRAGDHPINREAPAGECTVLKALAFLAQEGSSVCYRSIRIRH